MNDSDDDSSDSSDDFAGITPRDELTASFFSIKPATSSKPAVVRSENENESSDDDNFTSVLENNGIELFSEVVKNLEASQRILVREHESKQNAFENDTLQDIKRVKTEKKGRNISDEINAVLLEGESGAHAFHEDDREADNNDVKESGEVERPNDYSIPKDGVKITLPGTNIFLKKKLGRKESDLAAILRRKLKANQIIIEKAARLCWLAHGFYLNRLANDPEMMAMTVSLISTKNYPNDSFDLAYLAKFTKWFKNLFTMESSHEEVVINKETLLRRIEEKKIYNYRELTILYVAILRGIGLHCRLVVSLNPPPVRTFNELLPKGNTAKKNDKTLKETLKDIKPNSKFKETGADAKETKGKAKQSKKDTKRTDSKKNLANNSLIQNNESARRDANLEAKKRAAEILRSKYSYNKKDKDKLDKDAQNAQDSASTSASKANIILPLRRLRSSKTQNVVAATKQENNVNSKTSQSKTCTSTKHKRQTKNSEEEEEEEEEGSSKKLKRKRTSDNKTTVGSKDGKDMKKEQASTDDEEAEDGNKLKKRQDVWAEVYVESKGSWICVNVLDPNVDCIAEVYVSI